MSPVVRSMTPPVHRAAVAVGAALVLVGCAAEADDAASAPSSSASVAPTPADPADGSLALQLSYVDGCASPGYAFSRLPLAVYADGRVVFEGASADVDPPSALPGGLLGRIEPQRVDELVARALDAGLGEASDLGAPSGPDAPWARVTVVADGGTAVTDVHFPAECPGGDSPPAGLTDEQTATWEQLLELSGELNSVTRDEQTPTSTRVYEPEAVAAVVTAWTDPDDGPQEPEPVRWPGPPLPGEPLDQERGVSCVIVSGDALEAVLDAAGSATSITPWTDEQGRRWTVALRPLLPHERSCADLPAA